MGFRLSEAALKKVAEDIAPHVGDVIERDGQLSMKSIAALAKEHAEHSISSERSCRIVDEYLCSQIEEPIMTATSKTNPTDPAATDYTWLTKDYATTKAGRLSDGRDVCYIEDLQTFLEPDEAISLGTDLLRWAQFIKECADEREAVEIEAGFLRKRQAE